MAKIVIENKRFLVDGIDIGDKVQIDLQVRNVKGFRFVDCSMVLAEDDEINANLVEISTFDDMANGERKYMISREEGD